MSNANPLSDSPSGPGHTHGQSAGIIEDPLLDDGFTSISWDQPAGGVSGPSSTSTHNPGGDSLFSSPLHHHDSSDRPHTTHNDGFTNPAPSSDFDAPLGGGGYQTVDVRTLSSPDHHHPVIPGVKEAEERARGEMKDATREEEGILPTWDGKWVEVKVQDPIKEHEGSKDVFVSYAVVCRVSSLLLYLVSVDGDPCAETQVSGFKVLVFISSLRSCFDRPIYPTTPLRLPRQAVAPPFSPRLPRHPPSDDDSLISRISNNSSYDSSQLALCPQSRTNTVWNTSKGIDSVQSS